MLLPFLPSHEKRRFDQITLELHFTNNNPSTYHNCFWEVCELTKWNDNMSAFFPSRIVCLEESMSIWFQWWTCPGWVFSIWEWVSHGMLWIVNRGDGLSSQTCPWRFWQCGRKNVWFIAVYAAADTSHCLLCCIGQWLLFAESNCCSRRKRIFFASLKPKYWPTLVSGMHVLDYFRSKVVSSIDAISSIHDIVKYIIWCMKEPDYIMKIMATVGSLCSIREKEGKHVYRGRKNTNNNIPICKAIQMTLPLPLPYAMGNHNNLHHDIPSIKRTWLIDWCCLVSFLFCSLSLRSILTWP